MNKKTLSWSANYGTAENKNIERRMIRNEFVI